ncbi:MAG: tetratricopeptide repeat protein [Bacteroidales bacterium]|nr:tetratricopeptide repeat protein [Bacteroidales bacterium]
MKNSFVKLLIVLLLALSPNLRANNVSEQIDSLNSLIEEWIYSDPYKALRYSQEELNIAKRGSKEYVDALNYAGKASYYLDEYKQGIFYLEDALREATKLNYQEGRANVLFSLGDLHILLGIYGKAIDYLVESLEIFQEIKNNTGTAYCLNGLGIIHMNQGNFEKAYEYFERALAFGDQYTKADSYTNMGTLYIKMEAFDEAIKYAGMSLEEGRKNEDLYVISASLDNLGYAYLRTGKTKDAIKLFLESKEIKTQLDDRQGLALTLVNIGLTFKNLNESDSSELYFSKAYFLSEKIGAKKEICSSALEYSRILASKGNYDSAFIVQNRYIEVSDEINNEKASKKIAELEAAVEAEKQAQQIALLQKDKEFQKEIRKYYIYIGAILLLLFIAFIIFMNNRYRLKKKSAEALEIKNQIIEEKNNDIMDSIRYAKRIQEAILPPISFIKEWIPNSFVLFLPKDVVAGDFYWMNHFNNKIYIAACDCTGHGVPGAMVSVMCSNYLHRVVKELKVTEPGQILDNVTDMVIENFEKSENEVKDGMDVSLCVFDEERKMLKWAGANNPLWIIRVNGQEVEEVKANKQPIGKYSDRKQFTSHEVPINKGDLLYMFSDGYADQFGGDAGKKFKSLNFKKFLLSIKDKDMEEQKELILKAFNDWKGTLEQVDDVCVIGIRV